MPGSRTKEKLHSSVGAFERVNFQENVIRANKEVISWSESGSEIARSISTSGTRPGTHKQQNRGYLDTQRVCFVQNYHRHRKNKEEI